MKYNCPICGTEMLESDIYNRLSCREDHMIDVRVLDAIAEKEKHIAILERKINMLNTCGRFV